jgi:hypothetical protein
MKPLPYRFPDQRTVIRSDAQETMALPPDERLRALLDFIAAGEWLFFKSPNREASLAVRKQQRMERRRALQDFLTNHGC